MNTTDYKSPDLTAPRYRPTVYTVSTPKLFKEFYKKYPQHKDIDVKTLRKIITTFNTNLWKEVINNPDGIELPEALGTICAIKCKTKKTDIINYNLSNKLGKKVLRNNLDTDNLLVKITYSNFKNKYNFFGKQVWIFRACRDFKRTLSKEFRKDPTRYHQLDMHERFSRRDFPETTEVETFEDPNYDPLNL